MWAFKAVDKREKMLCLHIFYICKYLAYLCRVQKKQHWLSLRWESGCPGNRHKTRDLSLYPFVLNSELCEDTNYSQEPDEVQTTAILALGRLRQEDLSSRQSGLYTTFLDWPGLY